MDETTTGGPAAEGYAPPNATEAGSLAQLAAGSYSDGASDDGDYHTVKYHP